MTRYIVFDNKGIIHNSNNESEALKEYEDTEEFEGDLYFAQVIAVRR